MAKLTLNTIGSRYGSIDALNDNFNAIETAIENTFSLDGTSPNALEADLDMNSNDILNAGEVSTETLRINGVLVEPGTAVTSGAAFQTYSYTATAGQTSFSVTPATPFNASIVVIVNGLQLSPSEISVSGTNVITPALTLGDEVVIRRYTAEPVAAPDATEVNFIQAGTGAVTRTSQNKMRESVSVNDFWSGSGDATAAVNAALVVANQVVFMAGYTYNLTADVAIPSNRKIIVQKGATVINTGGRFTAYDVDNVEWQIDGLVQSVSMATAAAKSGWPAIANGYLANERGFIEFGGSSTTSPRNGFVVGGSGIVSGDWTGTAANATVADLNKKGIAVWNAKNVLVEISETYGFQGEAVYFWGISSNCVDVKFQNIYSHDHKFNALNFNVSGPERGLQIHNCVTLNCYSGIEVSAGEIIGNQIYAPLTNGIWTGVGAGGKTSIRSNVVRGSGLIGIYAGFSPLMSRGVAVTDNIVEDSGTFGILVSFCRDIQVLNNTVRNWGVTATGYAIQISDSDYGQVATNTVIFPGSFSSGNVFTSFNTTNLSVGENAIIPTATQANIDKEYSQGTFAPTATNLTTTGSGCTITGAWTKIGRLVNWNVTISPIGGATSASTISSTTLSPLPFTAAVASAFSAASGAVASLPNGLVSGTTVFAPTWSATSSVVYLNGSYYV